MRGSDLHEEMVAFFEEPWACLDLESLVLNGLLVVPINSSCSSTEPGVATSASPSTPTSNLNTASEKGLASMVRWRPAKTFDNNSSAPPRHFHNPSELEETIRLLLLSTDPLTKLRQLSVNCATFERVNTH
ncbi:hypothetical protein BGZ51_008397 [Haplosporangium sp. Z 767]|nr:hypothetical protein BGZ50_008500 [Haplosporangium sp. Z 11]KAF9177780.1 hypothetical protein BGZ51_008397 [Haplosporangium sp. Z 767]